MSTFRTKSGKFKASALKALGLSGSTHFVACPGEARFPEVGGMIDNCGLCAPHWGELEIPSECPTVIDWANLRQDIDLGRTRVYALHNVTAGLVIRMFAHESAADKACKDIREMSKADKAPDQYAVIRWTVEK